MASAIEQLRGGAGGTSRADVLQKRRSGPLHMTAPVHIGTHDEDLVSAETLRRINGFAWEIASQMYLPNIRQVAVRRTQELCDADGATLFLLDPATGELCFELVEGGGEGGSKLVDHRLAPGQGVAGRVALERTPALVARTAESRDFAPEIDDQTGFSTGSIVAVPLCFGSEVLGVLEAVRSSSRPSFTPIEQAILTQIAPHLTAAVQHARAEDALRQSREALVLSNEVLEAKVQERTALISRAKSEWEGTFDAIQDPIVVLDGFGVRRANREYQALTGGRPWSEIVGSTCHRLLAKSDTPCLGCPLLSEESTSEVQIGDRQFHASRYLMESPAGPSTVVHYRDVTEQRALADRLRDTERLAAVGQLASGAAHEINNPLALLVANLDQLKESITEVLEPAGTMLQKAKAAAAKGIASDVREALNRADVLPATLAGLAEIIEESLAGARRITRVVKSLRELSRQETGNPEPMSTSGAVQRAAKRVLGEHHAASLSLNAGKLVLAAPLQLELALANVIHNARQASPNDQAVSVATTDEGSTVVIQITDRGCGIPSEHLQHVFEPFFTTRKVGEGQGLGLAVAYGIIKRAGGDISIASELGRGTTVTIVLPEAGSTTTVAKSDVRVGRYAEREFPSSPSGIFGRPRL